jgi:hypothetical protein
MQRSQPSPALLVRNFHHCSDDEYARFLTGLPVTPEFRRMRRRYRRDFVEGWPKLEDWLAERCQSELAGFAARRRSPRAIRFPIGRGPTCST